ncbi:MAG: hypothetical protein AAF215_05475 [Cyanobacteria bacterium P01_A01_bin.123]
MTYLELLKRWEKLEPGLVVSGDRGSIWFHWPELTPVWFKTENEPYPLSLAILSHYILTHAREGKLDLALTINSMNQGCIAAIVQDTKASAGEDADHTLALMEAWVNHLERIANQS